MEPLKWAAIATIAGFTYLVATALLNVWKG